MNKIQVFPDNKLDPVAVLDTSKLAFKRNIEKSIWMKSWNWLTHRGNGLDCSYSFFIMDGTIVACFLTIVPMKMLIEGIGEVRVGLAITGMTHPSYQGKGYYSSICKYSQEYMKNDGFSMLIAFDNHNSHYPEVKYLNWKDIGVLNTFSLCASKINNLAINQREFSISTNRISLLDTAELANNYHTNEEEIRFDRGYDFLKWRLNEHFSNDYYVCRLINKAGECSVIAVYKYYLLNQIDIMEIFFHNDKGLYNSSASSMLLGLLAKQETKTINMWSNLFSLEHQELEKAGFQELGFSAYLVYCPLIADFQQLNLRNIHIRFIDSDVF